jgi:hypothetical protein
MNRGSNGKRPADTGSLGGRQHTGKRARTTSDQTVAGSLNDDCGTDEEEQLLEIWAVRDFLNVAWVTWYLPFPPHPSCALWNQISGAALTE